MTTEMWCVELTLTNEDDEQSKALNEFLKKKIGEKCTLWMLGDFLARIRQYKQAEVHYRRLDYILAEEDVRRPIMYNRIAYVRYKREDYDVALDNLQTAMKHASIDTSGTRVTESEKTTILGEVSLAILCAPTLYRQSEDHEIVVKYLTSDSPSISIIQNNFGCVYYRLGDFTRALEYYEKALPALLKYKSNFDLEISALYNNIGAAHYGKKDLDNALKNFYTAMTTLSASYVKHRWIQQYTENYQAIESLIESNKTK